MPKKKTRKQSKARGQGNAQANDDRVVIFDPVTGVPVQSDKVYQNGGVISPFLSGYQVEFEFAPDAIVINALSNNGGLPGYDRFVYPGTYQYSGAKGVSGVLSYAAQGTYDPQAAIEYVAVNRPLTKGRFAGGAGLQSAISDANYNQPESSVYYYDSFSSPLNIEQRRAEGYPADSSKAALSPLGLTVFYQDEWWNELFSSNLL